MLAESTRTVDVLYEDGDKANMNLKQVFVLISISHWPLVSYSHSQSIPHWQLVGTLIPDQRKKSLTDALR